MLQKLVKNITCCCLYLFLWAQSAHCVGTNWSEVHSLTKLRDHVRTTLGTVLEQARMPGKVAQELKGTTYVFPQEAPLGVYQRETYTYRLARASLCYGFGNEEGERVLETYFSTDSPASSPELVIDVLRAQFQEKKTEESNSRGRRYNILRAISYLFQANDRPFIPYENALEGAFSTLAGLTGLKPNEYGSTDTLRLSRRFHLALQDELRHKTGSPIQPEDELFFQQLSQKIVQYWSESGIPPASAGLKSEQTIPQFLAYYVGAYIPYIADTMALAGHPRYVAQGGRIVHTIRPHDISLVREILEMMYIWLGLLTVDRKSLQPQQQSLTRGIRAFDPCFPKATFARWGFTEIEDGAAYWAKIEAQRLKSAQQTWDELLSVSSLAQPQPPEPSLDFPDVPSAAPLEGSGFTIQEPSAPPLDPEEEFTVVAL